MRIRIVVLVAGLAASVAAATATAQGPMTIRLVSVTTSDRQRDVPPAGPSRGDTSVQTSRLHNAVAQFAKPRGAVVGRDSATLRLTGPTSATIDGVATLPGGTLTLRGAMRVTASGLVFPVVRGTGRFAGARGTVTVTALAAEKTALNVYRLVYPPTA
jgi:hypothetical protein